MRSPQALSKLHGRTRRGSGTAQAEELARSLAAELVLLREENTRLRLEPHLPPDPGRLIERMRLALGDVAHAGDDDDAWRVLGEALVLREVLADLCREIVETLSEISGRLARVGPALAAPAETPVGQNGNGAVHGVAEEGSFDA